MCFFCFSQLSMSKISRKFVCSFLILFMEIWFKAICFKTCQIIKWTFWVNKCLMFKRSIWYEYAQVGPPMIWSDQFSISWWNKCFRPWSSNFCPNLSIQNTTISNILKKNNSIPRPCDFSVDTNSYFYIWTSSSSNDQSWIL